MSTFDFCVIKGVDFVKALLFAQNTPVYKRGISRLGGLTTGCQHEVGTEVNEIGNRSTWRMNPQ